MIGTRSSSSSNCLKANVNHSLVEFILGLCLKANVNHSLIVFILGLCLYGIYTSSSIVVVVPDYNQLLKKTLLDSAIVLVPFEPFHTCDKINSTGAKPLQVGCHRTILLEDEDKVNTKLLPFQPDLLPSVCNAMPSSDNSLKETVFMLCVQTPKRLGVLVRTKDTSSEAEGDAATEVSFAHAAEAEFIASALEPTTAATTKKLRIVERKTIAMIGYYPPVSVESDLKRSQDANLGNFLWQYAATRMINQVTTHIIPDDEVIEKKSPSFVSAYVIATANCLDLSIEGRFYPILNMFRERLQTFRAPSIVLGMGMQAEFEDIPDVQNLKFFPFQQTLLQEMARWQRIPSIGVRGKVTQRACENSGITHCVSAGCPTLIISRNPNLGKTLEQNWKRVEEMLRRGETIKVAMASPAMNPDGKHDDDLRMLMDMLLGVHDQHYAVFNLQMSYDRVNLEAYATKYHPGKPLVLKAYKNTESWLADTEQVDFVLSTRIHGGMVGISTGVPSIVIPTDFRIQELIDAMYIPYLTMDDVAGIMKKGNSTTSTTNTTDLVSILQHARNKDFKKFEETRRDKIRVWHEILKEAGLEMDPELLSILSQKN